LTGQPHPLVRQQAYPHDHLPERHQDQRGRPDRRAGDVAGDREPGRRRGPEWQAQYSKKPEDGAARRRRVRFPSASARSWPRKVTIVDPRRHVPRTDVVLADPRLVAARELLGVTLVKAAVARAQAQARAGAISPASVADAAAASLPPTAASVIPVINATGIVVHTNLGRAPLSAAAREAVQAAAGCTDVEFDLAAGKRARRGAGALDALARAVPAAGAVHVVNNNAAALVLAATALAAGREIIVSRGELIEIGDRFRLPDLLQSTGARIREVGTTNRTALADYQQAVGSDTAFILKVHPSNYVIEGFTASVGVAELASLGVLVVGDIGSGLLRPSPVLPDEPDADTWLRGGAGVVTASGDKLLGGPQAGLLLGERETVTRLARHPLARALRVDKLTLAALEATLTGPAPPVTQALTATGPSLRARAETLAVRLALAGVDCRAVAAGAAVGGGGGPGVTLPSAALSLPERLAAGLRSGAPVRRGEVPAVVGRVEGGRLLLDLRAVAATEDELLAEAVLAVAGSPE
jgi:L-seryl-tRNA(Ser) seleniumtransferase